jgi:hypothetical protein
MLINQIWHYILGVFAGLITVKISCCTIHSEHVQLLFSDVREKSGLKQDSYIIVKSQNLYFD